MKRFTVTDLPLEGLKMLERRRFGDNRGFLSRLFCAEELLQAGWIKAVAQINHTYTAGRGTVRGMHFQSPPHAEMKMVACLSGQVYDVAADVRYGSKTFLHCHGEILSADNGRALLIPEGFAHGFQTLTDDVELLYCHSEVYAPEAESGLSPLDPYLFIDWPLPVDIISVRDANFPRLDSTFTGIKI